MTYEDHRTATAPSPQWCPPPPPLPRRNITSYPLTTISTLGNNLVNVKNIIRCDIVSTTTCTREATTNVIIFEHFNFYNNTKRKSCQNYDSVVQSLMICLQKGPHLMKFPHCCRQQMKRWKKVTSALSFSISPILASDEHPTRTNIIAHVHFK